MRICLHLGCGLVHRPGWINLDRYVTDGADLQADAVLLPFADGSAEAIEVRQLIEHLGYVGTRYALYEWSRVLCSPGPASGTLGGTLLIETPDRAATLSAAASEHPATLPWLFGLEQRGQDHRYLFSAAELVQLLEQAGFEDVRVEHLVPRPARPTLRITARRAANTKASRFAAQLHRALVRAGILDPGDAAQYLSVLETICEQVVRHLESPTPNLVEIVSLTARYSPRLATCVLDCLPLPAHELSPARRLIADLAAEQFPARLACRWRTLPKLAGAVDAAWAQLEREISLYLGARICPGEGLDDVRAAFDAAVANPLAEDLSVDFFCRAALTDLARRLTARGVRAFARDDLAGGAAAFRTALGYDPDLLWPRWNLARLYFCQGRRLDALAQYEQVQANLHPGLCHAFEREMDAVTGRDGNWDRFLVPLADLADLLEEAS